jgi:8-oxo-dGTP pyrophosphatase MutT (NUDIX family)
MKGKQRRRMRGDEDPLVGVGAVIYRARDESAPEVLLIRKLDGYWTLPKGQVQPGESEADALVREVLEETGLSGTIGAPVRTVSYVTPNRRPARRKRVTFYLFAAGDDDLDLSRDEGIVDARWLELRPAQERVHRKRIRRVLRDAAAILQPAGAPPKGAKRGAGERLRPTG